MTWFGWALTALVVLGSAITILMIGEKRQPITHGIALGTLILNALIIWGAVTVGTN